MSVPTPSRGSGGTRYCYVADVWEDGRRVRAVRFFAPSRVEVRRYAGENGLSLGEIHMDPTRTGEANGWASYAVEAVPL